MVLVREPHEADRPLELLERHVELLGLLHGAAEVALRVHDQERRADVARVRERGAIEVPLEVLPGRPVDRVGLLEPVADVAGPVHAPHDVDGALGARGPESTRVADDPARHEAAVAPAHHSEARGVEKVEPAERLVEPGHDIGIVPATPVPHDRPRKRLAVAPTAPGIEVHDGVSRARVDLELVEESVAVLARRPPVDVEEYGVSPARLPSVRGHHPAVDGEARPVEPEALGSRPRHLRLPLTVQVGQPPLAGSVGLAHEHLGRRRVVRGREGDAGAVGRRGEGGHLTGSADQRLRGAASSRRDPVERHVPLVLHLEHDGPGRPEPLRAHRACAQGWLAVPVEGLGQARREATIGRNRVQTVVPGDSARVGVADVDDGPSVRRVDRRRYRSLGARDLVRVAAADGHREDVGRAVLVPVGVSGGHEGDPLAVGRPRGMVIVE